MLNGELLLVLLNGELLSVMLKDERPLARSSGIYCTTSAKVADVVCGLESLC